jgi:hypothetical protein
VTSHFLSQGTPIHRYQRRYHVKNVSARNGLRTAPADNVAQLRTRNSTELSTTRSTCVPRASQLRNQLCHQAQTRSSATYSLLSHFPTPLPFLFTFSIPLFLFVLPQPHNLPSLYGNNPQFTHVQNPHKLLLTSQALSALPSDSNR